MAEPPVRTVAAFDFDGTLCPGDSLAPFLRRAVPPRVLRAAVIGARRELLALPRGGAHRDRAKEAVLGRALAGVALHELEALAGPFSTRLERRLRADVLARARWHQAEGHEVVLVSASPELYLRPLAERLGFRAVLATRLEVVEGRCTGRILGANVRGPEKERRLREWLGAAGDPAATVVWAYGDSAGDRELLALADVATRVGRARLVTPPPGQAGCSNTAT